MHTVIIEREKSCDEGTFGTLIIEGITWCCFTGELPWRDNAIGKSCIPIGTYECVWHKSPKFGWCYRVKNVPGRSHILIHAANFMGDRSKGFKSELNGCIALGNNIGIIPSNLQKAIIDSRVAVNKFASILKNEPFKLIIKEKEEVNKNGVDTE